MDIKLYRHEFLTIGGLVGGIRMYAKQLCDHLDTIDLANNDREEVCQIETSLGELLTTIQAPFFDEKNQVYEWTGGEIEQFYSECLSQLRHYNSRLLELLAYIIENSPTVPEQFHDFVEILQRIYDKSHVFSIKIRDT